MPQIKTSKGRPVPHRHSDVTLSPATVEAAKEWMDKHFPNVVQKRQASCSYNCHGFSVANRHGWFDDPTFFLVDEFEQINMSDARVGDVLVYNGKIPNSHSAIVTRVFAGRIVKVRSKWGGQAEVIHDPDEVDDDFGSPDALYRRQTDPPDFKDAELPDKTSVEDFVRSALERLSEPDVYLRLMVASTPEVTRKIIADLPGVDELISIGPVAAQGALAVFEREAERRNHFLTNIMSYILQSIPTPEAARPLAKFLVAKQVNCFDSDLIAEAFVASHGIEVVSDLRGVAFREAQKLIA